jgi:hypothetical protein
MKRILSAAACCLLIVVFTGCQKKDQWHWAQQKKCDYVYASSKALSDASDEEWPLFAKTFDNSGKLTKISAAFRNIVGGIYEFHEFNVRYQGNHVFFVRPRGDTAATFEFNNNKKLIWAVTSIPFATGTNQLFNFRFSYQSGRLQGIDYQIAEEDENEPGPNDWYGFMSLLYDGHKNVSRLTYSSAGYADAVRVDYEYDYQKKAKEQFYPDEAYGDTHNFWYFLKYLNIFPEVNGPNLLKRSMYTSHPEGYPATYERIYSEHKLDGSGKLVSYWQKPLWNGLEVGLPEFWKIKWNCFNK